MKTFDDCYKELEQMSEEMFQEGKKCDFFVESIETIGDLIESVEANGIEITECWSI